MGRKLNSLSFKNLVKQLIREEKRRAAQPDLGLLERVYVKQPDLRSLTYWLFEADDGQPATVNEEEPSITDYTLLVLYGPPAAGKGVAKKSVGAKFKSAGEDQSIADAMADMSDEEKTAFEAEMDATTSREEDKFMTSITTGQLPVAVFAELHGQANGDPAAFDTALDQYWHKNEDGQLFNLSDVIQGDDYKDLLDRNDGDAAAAAEEFKNFPETASFFAQARGFSKSINGLPDDVNQLLGVTDEQGRTLGVRAAGAQAYFDGVKQDLEKLMGAGEKFGSVYVADQAGESTTNIDRIKSFSEWAKTKQNVKVVGVYIHQPLERTTIANLHRKAFDKGGRRVAQSEVEAISNAGPEFDAEGNMTSKGAAVEAMEDGYDAVYVYHPGKGFSYDIEADGRPIGDAICEPFGDGKGALDIKGCSDESSGGPYGSATEFGSIPGLEKKVARKAGVEDGQGLIKDTSEPDELQAIADALNGYGFTGVTPQDVTNYLQTYAPGPAERNDGSHAKTPYGMDLFVNMKADQEEVVKEPAQESARTSKSGDDLILERWKRLAGLNS